VSWFIKYVISYFDKLITAGGVWHAHTLHHACWCPRLKEYVNWPFLTLWESKYTSTIPGKMCTGNCVFKMSLQWFSQTRMFNVFYGTVSNTAMPFYCLYFSFISQLNGKIMRSRIAVVITRYKVDGFNVRMLSSMEGLHAQCAQ